MIMAGSALLVVGILAAALFVSGWRGRSAASRRRALVTTPQISTPGVGGFIVLPCAAVMSAAGGVLLMVRASV